jgi:hypothetical protein
MELNVSMLVKQCGPIIDRSLLLQGFKSFMPNTLLRSDISLYTRNPVMSTNNNRWFETAVTKALKDTGPVTSRDGAWMCKIRTIPGILDVSVFCNALPRVKQLHGGIFHDYRINNNNVKEVKDHEG